MDLSVKVWQTLHFQHGIVRFCLWGQSLGDVQNRDFPAAGSVAVKQPGAGDVFELDAVSGDGEVGGVQLLLFIPVRAGIQGIGVPVIVPGDLHQILFPGGKLGHYLVFPCNQGLLG